jgi:hypothetical protein
MWPFKKKNEFDVSNFGKTMGYVPYKAPPKQDPIPPGVGNSVSGTKWWQIALPALSVALSSIALAKASEPDLQQYNNQPQTVYVPYNQPQSTESSVIPVNFGVAMVLFFMLLLILKPTKKVRKR